MIGEASADYIQTYDGAKRNIITFPLFNEYAMIARDKSSGGDSTQFKTVKANRYIHIQLLAECNPRCLQNENQLLHKKPSTAFI